MSADVPKLLKVFKKADKDGKGKIGRFQLAEVFQELDEQEWTADDLNELFDSADPDDTGLIKYKKFLTWVMEDDKGQVQGSADDGDDDSSEDEEDNAAALEVEFDSAPDGLDLTTVLTKKQFLMVMRRLDEDETEANEAYEDIVKACTADGTSTSSGVPVSELLNHLEIDPEDRDSLKELKRVLGEVLDKEASGQEDAVGEKKVIASALDRLVQFLVYKNMPFSKARDGIKLCNLSRLGRLALEEYVGKEDDLTKLLESTAANPPCLPAHAGQTAAQQHCVALVTKIIEDCKSTNTKYTDPLFDLTKDPNKALYVDGEKPGYDCTVGKPAGFKRLSEICKDPVLFKGGVRPGDIIQGQIGTCFLLGAIGAVVSNNPKAIKNAFFKYDANIGVYGVRMCVEGSWICVIVDDYVPVDQYGRILFASSKDKQEVWVTLLEKAYCKMYRCYEMCDGGMANQAIFSLCGGSSGKLLIKKKHRQDPSAYFKTLEHARQHGWLLTTTFVVRKGATTGQGKCGEAVLPGGLVGGHVYSVLKVVDACGEKLVCCRNPWGTGEWAGKWSDKNASGEWTEAMKKATGFSGLQDGKFWMSIQDFVANSGGVAYARTFGPPWKKLTQYRQFKMGAMEAVAQWAYKATADDELGFGKGDIIEVGTFSSGWWYGNLLGNAKKGFFPGNYVKLKDRPVARFDLQGTVNASASAITAVVMLMQGNVMRQRKYSRRKQDGLNYKVTKFPRLQLVVIGPDGKVALQKTGCKQSLSGDLVLPGGGLWKIYCISLDGTGARFALRTYLKDGIGTLKEVPGATLDEVSAVLSS